MRPCLGFLSVLTSLIGLVVFTPRVALCGPRAMTVEEALGLAKTRSRTLKSLALRRTIAEASVDGGKRWRNPELRVGDVSSDYVVDRLDDLEVGLRWRPPALGETDVGLHRRQLSVVEIRVEAARVAHRLAAKVRRTHARLVFFDGLVALRKQQVETQSRRLGLVDGLVDIGRRSVVFQTKAQSWLATARSESTRAQQARSRAERDLQRLVGVKTPLEATTGSPPVLALSVDDLVALAATRRPESKIVDQRRLLAEARFERERLRNMPWFSFLEAKYHVDMRDPDRLEVLFGLDLPLFDWNGSEIEARALAMDRRQTEAAALAERISDEVHEAYALYREARLAWELTAGDAAALIEQTQSVAKRATAHGTVPTDEILELELLVLKTREEVWRSRYALDRVSAALYFAVGVEGPTELAGSKAGNE